jgi:prepilin-type processing-associated H-X9-DG protein
MKPRFSNQRNHALTLVEVLVVICTIALLAVIFLSAFFAMRQKVTRINCVNNLKRIGLAYRIWEGNHNDKYPMQVSVTNGCVKELALDGDASAIFRVMSNEFATPEILICPADTGRVAATNFTSDFNNSKISYFVNLDTDETYPQTFLSGDDNFEIGGVPVKSGLLKLSANTPIAWTAARHKFGGNIGLADGSVTGTSPSMLSRQLLQVSDFTNRLAIP